MLEYSNRIGAVVSFTIVLIMIPKLAWTPPSMSDLYVGMIGAIGMHFWKQAEICWRAKRALDKVNNV